MDIGFNLSMEQKQKLIMTPQLQMSIKILQMSSIELNEYIQNELLENPVLEIDDNTNNNEDKINWEEFAKNQSKDSYYKDSYYHGEEDVSPFNYIADVTTLYDYLLFQLHLTVSDRVDIKIGEYLINNIDDAGYLIVDVSHVAKHFKVTNDKALEVLKIIQSFDPPGIGARNVKECLIIQLSQQGILNDLIKRIIDDYLDEVANNKYAFIAKKLNITSKEAQAIGDLIKSLEPKPGRGFEGNNDIRYIVPDVYINKINGEYVVTLNDSTIPTITINNYYKNLLKHGDKETSQYVKNKLDSAAWLIKSIEQRKTTIYNVVNSIVSFQREFLDKGINYLRPLTLKEIAEDVGVHESTVSRAINGKYVQTSYGLYELKFFFTRGLGSEKDSISSESIKKMIKDIIDRENPSKPLSDQKITDMLNKNGVSISRRTVAKYREELNIEPTSKRRRI